MKFIRLLLTCLAWVIAFVAVLMAVAYAPIVQTWVAQLALDRQPGLKGSVESVSVGFTAVDLANLHLEFEGGTLTLPSLEASVPLVSALWNRKVLVRSLVAKNWTLDLSHSPKPKPGETPAVSASEPGSGPSAPADAEPAQTAARLFRGILSGWKLPCAGSLDGVELEGDILAAVRPGEAPIRTHVIIKGGGLAAGQVGDFSIDGTVGFVDAALDVTVIDAHGRLAIATESSRVINRVEIKADLSVKGGSLPDEGLKGSVDVAAVRTGDEENYALDLIRDDRHLAAIRAHFPDAAHRLAGTWKVDLRDSDFAPLAQNRPLPSVSAGGEGSFDTGDGWEQVHALGHLNAVADHLGALSAPLDRLGPVTFDARFDLTRRGRSIRADHLSVSLAGSRPIAVVESLQPFDWDEKTGELKMTDPGGDWMDGSIRAFPLAWLSSPTIGFTFAGGDATGEFLVRAADGGFALRPKTPLTAAGVSVQRAGRVLGRGLDLSLSLLANYTAQGWQVQSAPLSIASAGRHLATVQAKASGLGGADQPLAIAGTWDADLEALAAQPAIPASRWIVGHAASGDFSVTVGTATKLEGKLAVIGRDPNHSLTSSIHADVDANGGVAFQAPFKIAIGPSVSEVAAEGSWTAEAGGGRTELTLTGADVSLEHLALLAAPLAAAGGVPKLPAGPDRIPFWGNWVGHVSIGFDRMRAAGHDLTNVGGIFDFDHGSIRLKGAEAEFPKHTKVDLDGSISFDAAAPSPYGLKATAAIDTIDLARLIGAPRPGPGPALEGRFSVASTITGNGINLDDLAARMQEEFRLKSTSGIVRMLRTDVADAIPEIATPVADTLGTVGSMVGSFLGRKDSSSDAGKNPVSKTAQAVIDFTNQVAEIGCDEIAFTAVRGSDRSIHLRDIVMTAPDERLTGTGEITYVKDLAVSAQPLSLDLQFGARRTAAKLLAAAGLLSPDKDALGYDWLNHAIHLSGTLYSIDASQWHDLLAKAATPPKPAGPKKGG